MSSSETRTALPITPEQEPRLSYDPHTGRWSGANGTFSIWMDHDTFCAYVRAWYEWTTWRADLPPSQRFTAVIAYCQRLTYWDGCERNFDRRVHLTYV